MANCPHCGYHLRLTDWKPDCPKCGVNLNYYKANERLLDESEKAEAEHAKFQPKVDRAKAAYAGSWKAILRIVLTLLPVGALFLPLVMADGAKNVIDIYKYVSGADLGALLGAGAAGVSVAGLALSAVMILVCLILIVMSLGKHGKGRTIALYGVMFGAAAVSLAAFFPAAKAMAFPGVETALSAGVGAYLYVALQAVSFCWNLYVVLTGIPVKYTPCLIGGLPSEEYFGYIEKGVSKEEIRRKMLVALAELQVDAEAAGEAEA